MADILPFKKPDPKRKKPGNLMCKRGFHKWQVVKDQTFDVKQGKLVTLSRCKHCGKERTEAR